MSLRFDIITTKKGSIDEVKQSEQLRNATRKTLKIAPSIYTQTCQQCLTLLGMDGTLVSPSVVSPSIFSLKMHTCAFTLLWHLYTSVMSILLTIPNIVKHRLYVCLSPRSRQHVGNYKTRIAGGEEVRFYQTQLTEQPRRDRTCYFLYLINLFLRLMKQVCKMLPYAG